MISFTTLVAMRSCIALPNCPKSMLCALWSGTSLDGHLLGAEEGSVFSKIYRDMIATQADPSISSYEEGIRALRNKDGKPTVYLGSRDSFFGIEGLEALNLKNTIKSPMSPFLPKGSELR